MPAPANDNFASATIITGASGSSGPVTIDSATTQVGEPTGSEWTNLAQTVWYRWTCPASGSYYFDTAQSIAGDAPSGDGAAGVGSFGHLDTTLAVYTGTILASLSEVISSEDFAFGIGGGFASDVVFTAVNGTSYYIQVGTYQAGFTGTVTLAWEPTPIPANDNMVNVETLAGESGTVSGSNIFATQDTPYDPLVSFLGRLGYTVWYRLAVPDWWDPVGSRLKLQVSADTAGTLQLTILDPTVWPPTSDGDWTDLLDADINNPGPTSAFYTGAAPAGGDWFYIGLDAQDVPGDRADFELSWVLQSADPRGVVIAFDDTTFDTTPHWTRLDG